MKMSEWQPIETAPKDERILIYVPTATKTPVKMGFVREINPSWFARTGATAWDDRSNPQHATMWAPIPEPPK